MRLITVDLIEAFLKAKTELEQSVTAGNMTSYDNYKYYIGRIHGLLHAIEICQETEKRSLNDQKY